MPITYRSIGEVVFLVTSAEQWLFVFVVLEIVQDEYVTHIGSSYRSELIARP